MKPIESFCIHRAGKLLPPEAYSDSGDYLVFGSNSVMGRTESPLYEGPLTVMARIGSTCGAVRFTSDSCWVNSNASALVARDGTDPLWLFYLLSVLDFGPFKRGSGQPFIGTKDLLAHAVAVPTLPEQRAIASVLRALDDKIESNARAVAQIQRSVRTLFEHEATRTTSNLVPLSSIARFVNGKAFTKHAGPVGRPIIRIKELQNGVTEATPVAVLDADDDNIARFDDLLFSWSGTLLVVRWAGEEVLINQHLFKVVPTGQPKWFVEGWLRHHLTEFQAIARDKATTMGHIRRRDLDEAMVRIPPPDEMHDLDEQISPLDKLRAGLESETRHLIAIRAALLPKLVSGKLRVRDAEELIEEASAA